MITSEGIELRDVVIGRYLPSSSRARHWVAIDIRLTTRPGETMTTEHQTATDVLAFAASGMTVARRNSDDSDRGGQCLDILSDPSFEPVAPWTRRDVRSLLSIWRRWHLNDMRAACAHMTLPDDTAYDARRDITCAAGSGYRYGRAWLAEPLPDDVVTEVRRLATIAAHAQRWSWGIGPVDAS